MCLEYKRVFQKTVETDIFQLLVFETVRKYSNELLVIETEPKEVLNRFVQTF